MICLHKIVPLIVSLLGLIVGLLLLALLLKRYWPFYWAMACLMICSLPLIAHSIWKGLESDYPYLPISQVPKPDAVLVLSGMLGGFESEYGYVTEWGDPDRFFVGVQLVYSGKAERLIFTRGTMPWNTAPPEGEILKQKALEIGKLPDQVLLSSVVSNTSEEALAVKDLMAQHGLSDIILVTPSFHIPRAKLLFDQVGVKTYPYPTDFKAGNEEMDWLDFIPNADAFRNSSVGIREYIGRLYYWFKFA